MQKLKHAFSLPALIAIACLLVCATPMGKQNDAIYTFVDVGQGDCLHIRTADGRNYLMDGGGKYNYDVGKNILAPYLLKNGVRRLDGVFVSHLHTDHFKGIVELSSQIDIDAFYVYEGRRVCPESVTGEFRDSANSAMGENLRFLAAGDVVLMGGRARAEILFPPRRADDDYRLEMAGYEDENRTSLIVRFYNDDISVLMTGDISREGEAAALGAPNLYCDILKIAHHGSKTSTSEVFLAAVNPAAAVIQVGKNSYGHPALEVLATLEAASIPVYRNDKSGAVLIRPLSGGLAGHAGDEGLAGHAGKKGFAVQTVKRDLVSPMLLKPFERE